MPKPFKTQVFNKPCWITDEKELVDQFVKEMLAFYRKNGACITPLLILRLDDIAQTYLLIQRLENTLLSSPSSPLGSMEGEGVLTVSKSGSTPKKEGDNVVLEMLGKVRERLRKAIKELEESSTKAFTTLPQGIADRMRPIIKKAEGILENSLQQDETEEMNG